MTCLQKRLLISPCALGLVPKLSRKDQAAGKEGCARHLREPVQAWPRRSIISGISVDWTGRSLHSSRSSVVCILWDNAAIKIMKEMMPQERRTLHGHDHDKERQEKEEDKKTKRERRRPSENSQGEPEDLFWQPCATTAWPGAL
ncbi:hypothetical protein DICSQDRAFT_170482 [Dichomitus squalens LYAD-421 SS1]|uniref:Uncharacterized protein n=1 Tax=Dichomitus squalens (strain LYAD-421) TaxID=732165 RepID=R7T175_DICSQ|nr:uncharacterized protein DICSQDRAFT_170482 [Dichomitus squalens LYAD-421 SS1]EJF60937.1 hypothetical protein DICSQDRAFT_170482 [Dichomitus squalens LYAD-421 SS1]